VRKIISKKNNKNNKKNKEAGKKVLVGGGLALLILAVVLLRKRTAPRRVVIEDRSKGGRVVVESRGEGECPIGSFVDYGEGRYEIVGKEKHSFAGKEVELCCGEGEDKEENQKMKYCYSPQENQGYVIVWVANQQTGGQYQKYLESYPQEGKTCTRIFDEKGKVVMSACD